MRKCLADLAEKCKEGIEETAYESYYNGDNPNYFEDCKYSFDFNDKVFIEVSALGGYKYEVAIYEELGKEYPNVEKAIEDFLSANADPSACWQSAHDNDEWRNVESGCDPAFPRYGDFEKWAYS